MTIRNSWRCRLAGVVVVAFIAMPLSAQVDTAVMDKWSSVTVVHYRVVGEFSGATRFFTGEHTNRDAKVTDRIEIEFDWNQNEMKLVGKAVIRNFPTKALIAPAAGCPSPRVEGAFEFATVLAAKGDEPGPQLPLEVKRDYPGGAIPYASEQRNDCGVAWDNVKAQTETSTLDLVVLPAYTLAMPEAGNAKITPDGRSFVVSKDTGGWVWTYTPTAVK